MYDSNLYLTDRHNVRAWQTGGDHVCVIDSEMAGLRCVVMCRDHILRPPSVRRDKSSIEPGRHTRVTDSLAAFGGAEATSSRTGKALGAVRRTGEAY